MRLLARTLVTALATVVPLAVVPGPAAPAPAAAAAEFDLVGRGWGHGKGMSQWGAQGAASRGLSFRQIVNFYYPGTRVGSTTGNIRVLITAETRQALVVGHRSGLSVRSVSSGASYPLSRAGATRWRITPSADNATSKVWVHNGAWRLVRTITGQAEFVAPSIRLHLPSGSEVYRGRLRSAAANGQRDVVNIVSLETYLRGVVPAEVYTSWKPEALKAQAVAARSYAAFERMDANFGHFDVYDTTKSQVYGGVGIEARSTDAAIAATRGEIRTYGGKPAFTQFSSSNGGWSVKGSRPYLVAQADPYERVEIWERTLTQDDVRKVASGVGTVTAVQVVARDGNGAWGGRAVSVKVTGTRGSATVGASEFATILGLRSTYFRRV